MKLRILVAATKSYRYAMKAQGRRLLANLRNYWPAEATAVICGDESAREVADFWTGLGIPATAIVLPLVEGGQNYKNEAQLRIAAMRTALHESFLDSDADYAWELDSDVLPPPNALRCMIDTLDFDDGFYDVAFCTYPNDGFLGGFSGPGHAILPNVYDDEREIPDDVKAEGDTIEAEFKASNGAPSKELQDRMQSLRKRMEQLPPKANVFGLNAKNYRRRGWMDHAYPGVGIGAFVPSDWCGFGCNLMTRRAVELAKFEGYDGSGTEDLFICEYKWRPAGIRIACVTHAPCDHVLWMKKKQDAPADSSEYVILHSYHEQHGECKGHLRTRRVAWTPETWEK